MPPPRWRSPLRRHATSKLARAEISNRSRRWAFAAKDWRRSRPSRVSSCTRATPGEQIGSRVVAHAETTGPIEPAPAPGTRASSRKLFDNVPVRREYLEGASAEFTRISSWLSTFALAYPDVTFTLRHDGKDVWVLPCTDDPRERLAMVFGREAAAGLIPLEADAARMLDGNLRGFISAPGHDRADRRMQMLFVNGRLLRSTLLSRRVDRGLLDVRDDRTPSVRRAVARSPARARRSERASDQERRAFALRRASFRCGAPRDRGDAAPSCRRALRRSTASSGLLDRPARHRCVVAARAVALRSDRRAMRATSRAVACACSRSSTARSSSRATAKRSCCVDQHAAHERIAYESIVERRARTAPSEPLLVPITSSSTRQQSGRWTRRSKPCARAASRSKPFGERTYRIIATPAGYGARPFDLAGFLDDLTRGPKQRDVRERVWASLACHSVTVAGERLELDEMTTLVERLQRLRESDALPARPSDDGAAGSERDRADVQAHLMRARGVLDPRRPDGERKDRACDRAGATLRRRDRRRRFAPDLSRHADRHGRADAGAARGRRRIISSPFSIRTNAIRRRATRATRSRAIDAIHARGQRAIVGRRNRILPSRADRRTSRSRRSTTKLCATGWRAKRARTRPGVLHEWLATRDPQRAGALDPNDSYRVLRALEVALAPDARAQRRVGGVRCDRPVFPL